MPLDDSYARILDRIPTMPPAEQAEVAARYARTRDPRDAERLVLGNLRLVVKLARDLGPHRADLMDLVQEGNAGLAHAVKRFDPGHGARLTTYAVWWIRAYMMRYLMANSRSVSFASTREGRRRFFAHELPAPDQSLEANVFADHDGNRPDVLCEEHEVRARVRSAVEQFGPTLDARERAILNMRLLRDEPARLTTVGKRFAISGERARQLEARVRLGLRTHLASALGAPERAVA